MSSPVAYPDFLKGSDLLDVQQALGNIADAVLHQSADFLFGAGMSCASGVPKGRDLAVKLLDEFFPEGTSGRPSGKRIGELADEYPFEAIVQAVEGGNRARLTETLKKILWDPSFQPTAEHRALAAISMWRGRPRLTRVFTTNFDLLLEATFGGRAVRITEETLSVMPEATRNGKLPIIYLHGQLDGAYQITEPDVFSSNYSVLQAGFQNALHISDAFVFVGYSMLDPDFRRIYMEYKQALSTRRNCGKLTYVVSPAQDESSYLLGSKIWKGRNAVWFPLKAAIFFELLKHELDVRSDRVVRERIMVKYGIGAGSLAAFEELVGRTADILRITSADAIRFLDQVRDRVGASV